MLNKRIFYVADMVSLQSGVGDLVHVQEFINVLCKKGFKVTLLIKGKPCNNAENKNLNIKTTKNIWNQFPGSIFTHLVSFILMVFVALTSKPAFIYSRDDGINMSVIVGKILRIPVLLEINGNFSEDSNLPKTLKILSGILMKITYPLADRIIIPSKNQMSLLSSFGVKVKKIFNVPNGVNPMLFRPIDRNICRERLGWKNSFYFCFVGNLVAWQGLENAIIAFSKLVRDNPHMSVKLIIVGDGPLRKELERLAEELLVKKNILFFGTLPHKLIPYVINASDVCIAPFTAWRNKKIGISALKLFEYLACGKPVIAPIMPGTELIQNLDAGILVEPDNVDDLKSAFESAIDKLPFWEKKAHSLHVELARNHSWEIVVDNVIEIMNRILTNIVDAS